MTSREEPLAARILFVEDDREAREGYTTYLRGHGYDVQAVGTGSAALAEAEEWVPQVIVLDLGLPDIDGWEVARRLKAGRTTAHVPIIALTGADLPHERVSAMRAGCDRYLTKPCVPPDLLNAIRRCIDDMA